jgi:LmbE family N-acetylglucosaminyl deacetylase
MMDTADNQHPDSFWQADSDEATGRLVAIVRRVRPDVMVTYNERGDYGHPDHINAHRITVAAFEAAGDPARYPEQGLEPWAPKKLYFSAWPRSGVELMERLLREAGTEGSFGEDLQFMLELSTPDEQVTATIDVSSFIDIKRQAMFAHRTQMPADSWFTRMPESVWRQTWAAEHFRRAESHVPAPDQEDDLFAGLR